MLVLELVLWIQNNRKFCSGGKNVIIVVDLNGSWSGQLMLWYSTM